jgi:2-iminobutanoate/2-iminopropanoate deaminase
MACEMIRTDQAPAAIGPYSQAVKMGDWLFVSGQLGLKPDTGEFAEDGFEGQARQALENLKQILLAAGCELKNVVSVDVFLTDISEFGSFNRIYEEYFGTHKPARAVVEVKGLPRGGCVEIKCIASMTEG